MNKFVPMLLVGTMLTVGAGAIATAASAPDPVIGTWTLNVQKSKFMPGHAPKSETRTYEQTADGMKLTVSGVAADGSAISEGATFKYDGKPYPFTGAADFDTISGRRINGSTVKSILKKDGKLVGTGIRSISDHGKVLTLKSMGKDAKGHRIHVVMVFDKQ